MPEISFQYPVWFLVFCLLLGAGFAALLYFRDRTYANYSPLLRRGLALLRFLTVSIIAALLLAPLLKRQKTETQKPVIVFAQDESESMGMGLSNDALSAYRTAYGELEKTLSEKFDLRPLSFGDDTRDTLSFVFRDKVTNLSEAMQGLADRYSGQNLGGIILATDGIYNEGSNPLYGNFGLNVPVFPVAFGDTVPRRDLVVKRVFHNKIAYLGDEFQLQVDVGATNCAAAQSVLTIEQVLEGGNKILKQTPVSIGSNDFFSTQEVLLKADKSGVARYLVRLAPISGEANTANNTRELFIDVLDARQKILILANAPHPDVAALKQLLDENKNYEVQTAFAGKPGADPATFDFVVLHNLPSAAHDISAVLAALDNRRVPRLFMAGAKTNLNALNSIQPLIGIASAGGQTDEVTGRLAPAFSAFTLDPKIGLELPKYAPAVAPFGTFTAKPQAQVILLKRVGKVDTEQPLLAVGEQNGTKIGVLLCDGVWKWRLFNFLQNENTALFDELFGKTIQYLSLKEDKRKFRVETDKSVFNENEPVLFNAELYNDNYELINEPEVALSVRNSEGKEFPFAFSRLGKAYSLNAGLFPKGTYTYKASTSHNGQSLTAEGRFSVRPIELESYQTTANHALLRGLAEKTGGRMVTPSGLSELAQQLLSADTIKPVIFSTTETKPVIHLKWIFALLAALLVLEWFLRRYFGAY